MATVRFRHNPDRPLTDEEREQLARLAEMRDEDIDLSDIPEITEEAWRNARRPHFRPLKRPVTIRLDADLIEWFKTQAGDRPYQTEINRVLRLHVAEAEKAGR